MSLSPTALTLRELRKRGYRAAVVEHWNPHARIRVDLFGCVDVLAVGTAGTVAVQATSYTGGGGFAQRCRKTQQAPALPDMLAAGWRVLIWGWRKHAGRWTLARETEITHAIPPPASSADTLHAL